MARSESLLFVDTQLGESGHGARSDLIWLRVSWVWLVHATAFMTIRNRAMIFVLRLRKIDDFTKAVTPVNPPEAGKHRGPENS